jgi:uncharacterized protein YeaO (DUF488 family)
MQLKRVYDPPADEDGFRVLADRLWPRGVSKERGRFDLWARDVAPSDALRQQFGHEPERWDEFRRAYFAQLDALDAESEPGRLLAELRARAARGPLTLVFAARETERNNAVALKEYLERERLGDTKR